MEEPDTKRRKTTSNETGSADVTLSYGHMKEKIGQCLRKDDVEALSTLADLTPKEREQVTSGQTNGSRALFSILEKKLIISRHDVRWLQRNLKDIKNDMAAKILDDFIGEIEEEFELPSEPEYSEEEDEDDDTNTFEKFLEKVGMKDKYPGKLKLKSFMQLGINDENDYVHIFWQKLTSLNYRAGLLQEIVSKDYSMRDFIFCVLHCADDFLRQDILEKMSACQLAVPVVLQGVRDSKPVFLLWGLRRVMKKWRGDSDCFAMEQPIVSYPVLNISVLRIGGVRLSKSQLLNNMLSVSQGYSSHTFFLNREKDFAVPRYSPGSVECVWFLPMRESADQIFKEVIAFFNLRGDCTKHPYQTTFACKAAHLTVALVATSKRESYKQHIDLIRKNSRDTLFVSVSDEESRLTTSQKVRRPRYNKGWLFVDVVQMDILSKTVCEEIVKIRRRDFRAKTALKSLDVICGEQIRIDEEEQHCINARQAVCEIFKQRSVALNDKPDVLEFKKSSFPLQSDWKDLVEIDKASLQIETAANESFLHQLESKRSRKREKRKLQLQKNLSVTMTEYLRIIKSAKTNSVLLQYIFGYMQEKIYHMVDHNTRSDMNDIAELEREIRQMRDQRMTGSSENASGIKYCSTQSKSEDRHEEAYRCKLNECNKLYTCCRAKNLGGEHFVRELGQLYEAYMDLSEQQSSLAEEPTSLNVALLPSLAARLVTEMQSLEIMDGDTGCVPLTWVTSVLDTLTRELNDPKVLVLSVIGVQSSGKSTLLNSMFGVRFPVRAGRCTRGLFIQLLKLGDDLSVKLGFHYLVVVDSEGIRSIDHDDRRFDNELVTLALSIANVTIFNIEGENIGPDMTGILQIAAHALMRMKQVDLECHCRIVQQRVSDMTAADRNRANTKKIKETLDEATRTAAEEEGLEGRYQHFSDVVELQVEEDLQYVPCLWAGGMAPPNHLYGETISKIKGKLFEDIENGNISTDLSLSTFTERVRDVWKAIKEEDFVFNFHDSVKAVDYSKLCLLYNQWIGEMRQEVQVKIGKVLSTLHVDIKMENLQPDVTTLKDTLETEINEQRDKLIHCVEDYIARHPRKNTMLRHKQEFIHDVHVALNETETHSLTKINDEYEIKRIGLNLPRFRDKSREILTREAKAEARKVTETSAGYDNDQFNTLWQNMIRKLKRENNIRLDTVTASSLLNVCEKLLLKVTRGMAVGSEVQALLSEEGGLRSHLSLQDSSKYVTEKFVKSWLRQRVPSRKKTKQNNPVVNEEQLAVAGGEHFSVVPVMPALSLLMASYPYSFSWNKVYAFRHDRASTSKNESIPNDAEKQLMDMEEKRHQASTYLRDIVDTNFGYMQTQSKAFDANVFQMMLRKTLKELSTKHHILNIKLPHRLIAKGLLIFCGRSAVLFCTTGKSEIENYLDFCQNSIRRCYLSFLNQEEQPDAAADFIFYYTRKIFRDKVNTFLEETRNKTDYKQFTERVHIPWDLLHFLVTGIDLGFYQLFEILASGLSLHGVVNLYIERKAEQCYEEIADGLKTQFDFYTQRLISDIQQLQNQTTIWKEWCKLLANFLDCPFIESAGNIFLATEVQRVSEKLQVRLRETLQSDDHYRYLYDFDTDFDYTSFKNAAGLSYVCGEVCPMCGAWCDNIMESHTVHSSSFHRPRGIKGEEYPVKDRADNDCNSDSDSKSSSSSDFEEDYVPQYVLEDCFMSVASRTATFQHNGETHLCSKYKDVFPDWDIQPGKSNASNRLFWQCCFAKYVADEGSNIPDGWHEITWQEALESLEQAKVEQLSGRQPIINMPLKKRLLASCQDP